MCFRKIMLMLLFAISMSSNAQTVYFVSVSKNLSVGLGYNTPKPMEWPKITDFSKPRPIPNEPPKFTEPKVTFGIMQESKNKKFDDFSIKFINENGEEFLNDVKFEVDTIFHFTEEKLKWHECDYTISRLALERIYREVNVRDVVVVNGQEISGSAFVGTLRGIEAEMNKPTASYNGVKLWNWGPQNIQLMRFNGPGGSRDFRFMRSGR